MKTVLITGATSGIGLGCARKFAKNGDRVIITGRNTDKLSAISSDLQAQGTEVLTLCFDVRDRQAAQQAIESLPAAWQQIDVLVNNAGLALGLDAAHQRHDPLLQRAEEDIQLRLAAAVLGVVQAGVVIAAGQAVPQVPDGLRIDVAGTAVRVTNLKPGLVETNFSNIRFHGDTERAAKVYQGIKPLTGDDIADVAVFAANAPAHVQIAEVLILATHQASGSVIQRK